MLGGEVRNMVFQRPTRGALALRALTERMGGGVLMKVPRLDFVVSQHLPAGQ